MAKITLTHKEYCSTICLAKCCIVRHEDVEIMPCPKLGDDNLCTIYKERFVENKPFSFTKTLPYGNKLLVLEQHCGKIENLLKENKIPENIKKQCCFYNPKLLEIQDETKEP